MPTIQLVVFDLAGTTVYDNGSIAIAFQQAMRAHGYEVPIDDINPLMGYHKPLAIQMMLEKYEPDTARITDAYIDAIHTRFQQEMILFYQTTPDLRPLPHAEEVMQALQQKGIRVGLDTGFSRAIADVILERLGWLERGLANYLVASNEVPAGRPQPYMIQRMMAEAGIANTREVVKVGDTEVDVMEGKNAGCLLSIAVTTGAFTREQLLPYAPDYILDSLAELLPVLQQQGAL